MTSANEELATVDVVGVGNAIVDVIARATDEFVASEGLEKGSMSLIDADRAIDLYSRMGPGVEASGGSAANTMAGIASFGGSAAFIGKVAKDVLGDVFAHDMGAVGVHYALTPVHTDPPTARSLVLVTPDAQRTMNTFLGISSLLEPGDIDPDVVANGSFLFCEGYLWDRPSAKEAIRKALDLAHAAGRRTALALSDTFCVERHHEDFVELLSGPVDIVFANDAELASMYLTDSFSEGLERVRQDVELACITRGSHGSVLLTKEETIEIPAAEVSQVVDTTGAGDQYAAGVLFGLARGFSLERCGQLAALAAAEVISHVGPRPMVPFSKFLDD